MQIPKFVSEEAGNILRAVNTFLIIKLLQRDPNLRLGSGQEDAEQIKNHKYFKEINWDDVYNK